MRTLFICITIILGIPQLLKAQTCCSGGSPITSNLGIQEIDPKSWYIQLSYDYNFLDALYSGTQKLDDKNRERVTQTVMLQGIYALNKRISFNVLLTHVKQERTIFSNGNENYTTANGIGDAVLMVQYSVFSNLKRNLVIAAGPKIPIGKFDVTDPELGFSLAPDLQPGSGSWDGIIGLSHNEFHVLNPNFTITGTLGYRISSEGERFDGDTSYRFGNEFIASIGFNESFFLGKNTLSPFAYFQYRHTQPDKIDSFEVPGTGGQWINLSPGFSISASNHVDLNFSTEIPLYRNLQGTQLTTSYRFNVGVAIKLFNNQ